MEILKIHAAGIAKHGEIDYEAVVILAEGFNGADLRNVCTEAGMSAIRAERDYVIHEDFMKTVRKLNEAKKLESSSHYNADIGTYKLVFFYLIMENNHLQLELEDCVEEIDAQRMFGYALFKDGKHT
ncbi:26S proteasome regulatory subunit 10B homolog A-like isoform X2 [Euphorbia lathyris]|uniref:26S proteasome regulatory subunit 10B homolog A-like isoform X2 n=1 Tax=Euphorbia lathyris TaxID=212925 RepID=UPI0033139317